MSKGSTVLEDLSHGHNNCPPLHAAYAMGPPITARPLLPPNLWPHHFYHFITGLAMLLGVLNPLFTVPFTLIAIILANMVSAVSLNKCM